MTITDAALVYSDVCVGNQVLGSEKLAKELLLKKAQTYCKMICVQQMWKYISLDSQNESLNQYLYKALQLTCKVFCLFVFLVSLY